MLNSAEIPLYFNCSVRRKRGNQQNIEANTILLWAPKGKKSGLLKNLPMRLKLEIKSIQIT